MLDQTQYVSVERNDWLNVDHEHQTYRANQNIKHEERRELAKKVSAMGSVTKRAVVLAQILSPSGRVHIHHGTFHRHMSCFPQSICWRFPDKKE